jgi:hypothetical protein
MAILQVLAKGFGVFPKLDDTQQRLEWKIASLLFAGMGLAGNVWVTDNAAHTGNFWCFHAVTDCVIAAITYATGTSTGSPVGLTVKAGDRIYGNILSLTLSSGSGELYIATTNAATV